MKKKTDWSDKKEVLKAVQFNGMLLKNASNNLRDDKELVLAAINSVSSALKYASDNLKSDKELVLLAINKSSKEITFIPDSLKDDKDILDAINLRKRIKNIRKCLDEIDGDVFSVRYDPVQDFDEKYNYPIEFQIFMEEIGEIFISCKKGQTGHLVSIIETPKRLVGLGNIETSLYTLDDFEYDDEFCDHRAQDIKIFGIDVNAQAYGFVTAEAPYRFVSSYVSRDIEENFLEWFVSFINDELDSDPWFNKDIRLE